MPNPISDADAVAACKTLLAYHEYEARTAFLDLIHEHHANMVDAIKLEIERIPERTAAAERTAARQRD